MSIVGSVYIEISLGLFLLDWGRARFEGGFEGQRQHGVMSGTVNTLLEELLIN